MVMTSSASTSRNFGSSAAAAVPGGANGATAAGEDATGAGDRFYSKSPSSAAVLDDVTTTNGYVMHRYDEIRLGHSCHGVILPSVGGNHFREKRVENLYERFFIREKVLLQISLNLLYIFIKGMMLMMFGIFSASVTSAHVMMTLLPISVHVVIAAAVLLTTPAHSRKSFRNLRACAMVTWLCLTTTELVHVTVTYDGDVPDEDPLGRMSGNFSNLLIVVYVTYTMLPLPLLWAMTCAATSTVASLAARLIRTLRSSSSDELEGLGYHVTALTLACSSAHVVGYVTNFLMERSRRKTFVETRRCIAARIRMEKENRNQTRLILSVIPRFIALQLMRDYSTPPDHRAGGGGEGGSPNRESCSPRLDLHRSVTTLMTSSAKIKAAGRLNNPMYVQKYDNVSILFADVRGFTKLSTRLSAQKLVSTLNELFGKFDRLAQRHDCLRIKILGDCYYCVCGLPQPREDHAHSCVQMAFGMVRVIKRLRAALHYDLQMRIGIHTGSVLCGVIGSHKWQFDIWSEDVKIANALEAGGIPDRLHVSRATYRALQGRYRTEPGRGAERNRFLRERSVETFLIVDDDDSDDVTTPPTADDDQTEGRDGSIFFADPPHQEEEEKSGEGASKDQVRIRIETSPEEKDEAVTQPPAIILPGSADDRTTTNVIATSPPMTSPAPPPPRKQSSSESREKTRSRWRMAMTSSAAPPCGENAMTRRHQNGGSLSDHVIAAPGGEDLFRTELPFAHMLRSHQTIKNRRKSTSQALHSINSIVLPGAGGTLTSGGGTQRRGVRTGSDQSEEQEYAEEEREETNVRMEKEIADHKGCHLGQENIREVRVEFYDKEMEQIYAKIRDELFSTNLITSFVLLLCLLLQQFLIQPTKLYLSFVNLFCGAVFLLLVLLVVVAEEAEGFPQLLRHTSRHLHEQIHLRRFLVLLASFVLLLVAIATTLSCTDEEAQQQQHSSNMSNNSTNCSTNTSSAGRTRFQPRNSICNYPSYFYINGTLVLISCSVFRIKHLLKFLQLFATCLIFTVISASRQHGVFLASTCGGGDRQLGSMVVNLSLLWSFAACLYYQGRRMEYTNRLDMLRKLQAREEIEKMKKVQDNNHQLLRNIIPEHVTHHYLGRNKDHEELYSQKHDCVGVMFASIPNFDECRLIRSKKTPNHRNNAHFCLRLLNEIIFDFDHLITQEQFRCLEKIKTIGSTYMAASGLTPHNVTLAPDDGVADDDDDDDDDVTNTKLKSCDVTHLCMLAHLALLLKRVIDDINSHTSNDLKIRIGMAFGPVVAGVIGAKKPQYDIWGQAVNLASRMDSTGVAGHIQVPEDMYLVLRERGFEFRYREMTSVKGIGVLPTYFLVGCSKQAARHAGMSRALALLGSVVDAHGNLLLDDDDTPSSDEKGGGGGNGNHHYSLAHVVYRLVQAGNRRRRYGTATEWSDHVFDDVTNKQPTSSPNHSAC